MATHASSIAPLLRPMAKDSIVGSWSLNNKTEGTIGTIPKFELKLRPKSGFCISEDLHIAKGQLTKGQQSGVVTSVLICVVSVFSTKHNEQLYIIRNIMHVHGLIVGRFRMSTYWYGRFTFPRHFRRWNGEPSSI